LPLVEQTSQPKQEIVAGVDPDLQALLARIRQGDKAAEAELIAYARRRPDLAESLLGTGPSMQETWLNRITSDPIPRFLLEQSCERLKSDLLDGGSSPLERLLVERIAVCALQVRVAESRYAAKLVAGDVGDAAEFYDRQAERAQNRYLSAIKALAQIRKLEVNILVGQVRVGLPASQP
jgi:hypothetical protein